jgi:hypothetical protein
MRRCSYVLCLISLTMSACEVHHLMVLSIMVCYYW